MDERATVTRGKPITETEWAYAAGIIDGEGHIGIKRTKPWTPGRHPRHVAVMQVANSSYPMLAWLHERFGGSLRMRKQQKPHHKPTWTWDIAARNAKTVCAGISPYLVAKKRQAEILLDLQSSGERRVGHDISDAEVDRRDVLWREVSALNRKGAPATTE